MMKNTGNKFSCMSPPFCHITCHRHLQYFCFKFYASSVILPLWNFQMLVKILLKILSQINSIMSKYISKIMWYVATYAWRKESNWYYTQKIMIKLFIQTNITIGINHMCGYNNQMQKWYKRWFYSNSVLLKNFTQ